MKPFFSWNIPILTFISRTWMLFVFCVLTNWAVLSPHKFDFFGTWELDEMKGMILVPHTLFEHFGAILYVAPFTSAVLLAALLFIHLFYRSTIDADAHSGAYITDWKSCTGFQRVMIANIVRIGFIIGLCILCSGLAKG